MAITVAYAARRSSAGARLAQDVQRHVRMTTTTLGYERASRWQLAWMRCHWYSMPMSEVRALAAFDLTALSRALAGAL